MSRYTELKDKLNQTNKEIQELNDGVEELGLTVPTDTMNNIILSNIVEQLSDISLTLAMIYDDGRYKK